MSKKNQMGFSGLMSIYPLKNLVKSTIFPILIDICLIFIVRIFDIDTYKLIVFISETITSVIPNVLGFILTGYAVIISVTESKYLKIMVKTLPNKNITLYQTVNSTFAFVLMVLCATFIFGFLSNFILKANLEIVDCLSNCLYKINLSILFLLIFLFLYSIFAIKDVVFNIFNFGQFINKIEINTNNGQE